MQGGRRRSAVERTRGMSTRILGIGTALVAMAAIVAMSYTLMPSSVKTQSESTVTVGEADALRADVDGLRVDVDEHESRLSVLETARSEETLHVQGDSDGFQLPPGRYALYIEFVGATACEDRYSSDREWSGVSPSLSVSWSTRPEYVDGSGRVSSYRSFGIRGAVFDAKTATTLIATINVRAYGEQRGDCSPSDYRTHVVRLPSDGAR